MKKWDQERPALAFAEKGHSIYCFEKAIVNYTSRTLRVPPDLYANEGSCLPGISSVVKAKVIWGHIMFYLEAH